MATITTTASGNLANAVPMQAERQEETERDDDHGLPRFFYAAGAALIVSAAPGVVQRLPGISDWLQDADYGGHMVTNLAHPHITILGAGTSSLTARIYSALPRVGGRPSVSH